MPIITPVSSQTQSQSAPSDARAKAIAAFNATAQAAQSPVLDQNQVSPEEMSAITPPSVQTDTIDAVEAPKEVTKPSTPEEPALSSQYAQLARKEKAFRAQVNAVKAQEAQLRAREEAIKAKESEYQSQYVPKDRIAKDPLKVLQEQGYTSDQITQLLLNAPDPAQQAQQTVMDELRAEIRALRDAQDATNKTYQDNQTQSYQQAVNQIRNDAKQLVTADPTFETIKATNSVEDVVELITKTFEKDGVILSVEDAANAVEEYLVEEALKIARLDKIQKRLAPKQTQAPTQQAAQKPQAPQQAKTLTSTMGTSRPLTAKERAILAFKGELK